MIYAYLASFYIHGKKAAEERQTASAFPGEDSSELVKEGSRIFVSKARMEGFACTPIARVLFFFSGTIVCYIWISV